MFHCRETGSDLFTVEVRGTGGRKVYIANITNLTYCQKPTVNLHLLSEFSSGTVLAYSALHVPLRHEPVLKTHFMPHLFQKFCTSMSHEPDNVFVSISCKCFLCFRCLVPITTTANILGYFFRMEHFTSNHSE